MAAHIILVPTQFPDPRRMGPYGENVEETMALYGGGYQAVLRHRVEVLEGDWHPRAVTILEFPSYEQALAWYHSPEYAPLLELRKDCSRFNVILVDGLGPDETVRTGRMDDWEVERLAELEADERAQCMSSPRSDDLA